MTEYRSCVCTCIDVLQSLFTIFSSSFNFYPTSWSVLLPTWCLVPSPPLLGWKPCNRPHAWSRTYNRRLSEAPERGILDELTSVEPCTVWWSYTRRLRRGSVHITPRSQEESQSGASGGDRKSLGSALIQWNYRCKKVSSLL